MKRTPLIIIIILILGVFISLRAQASNASGKSTLKARVETNLRAGSKRSLLMNEFWVPLAQNADKNCVLYGDLRLMGDNQDSREFNLGLGFRHALMLPVLGSGVAGLHSWYDRRITGRGSRFNQLTAGGEWLGDVWDLRLNGYMPLNDSKTYIQTNPNGAGAHFAGTQIVVNTDQQVVEEALSGFDIELGWKAFFMDDFTDNTRIHAGLYHFSGDRAEDVDGWRTRIASDITPDFQVGARFQKDNVRGSQAFLEATLRFPFGRKKSIRQEGLAARLDESPERDIDIVSAEKITDDGRDKPLLNQTTGAAQNVIHVDNTAAGGGNGSNEARFNTLAAAQSAAGPHDIIYVHRGDGTTAGQAGGITLDDAGQMLLGSGTDFYFDSGYFATANNLPVSGTLLMAKTEAPVITNGAGNGIEVTADNVLISGLTINGANNSGIDADNVNNLTLKYLTILNSATNDGVQMVFSTAGTYKTIMENLTVQGNAGDGIDYRSTNNAVADLSLTNSNISGNSAFGGFIFFQNTANLTAIVDNNIFNVNGRDGVRSTSRDTATINMSMTGNTANQNTEIGFNLRGEGGSSFFDLTNNTANTNTQRGILIRLIADHLSVKMQGNTAKNNLSDGIMWDDDAATALEADMGGGSLGSAGLNQSFANSGVDIRVDIDGLELKAENNWWGNAAGLQPGRMILDAGSTIDAAPFLTEVP